MEERRTIVKTDTMNFKEFMHKTIGGNDLMMMRKNM